MPEFVNERASSELPVTQILLRRGRSRERLAEVGFVEECGTENHLYQGLVGGEVHLRLCERDYVPLADPPGHVGIGSDDGSLNALGRRIRDVIQGRHGD